MATAEKATEMTGCSEPRAAGPVGKGSAHQERWAGRSAGHC